MTLLDAVDGLPVDTGQFSEPFLREAAAGAGATNAVADGPAVGEYPRWERFGRRHGPTLAAP